MASHVALLRAVNVGGTGTLSMADLKAICVAAGCGVVRTYIASGNVVFDSRATEGELKLSIGAGLHAHLGAPVAVLIRTAAELADVLADNPFRQAPGNRVMAMFLDRPVTGAMLADATGLGADEEMHPGRREIYIRYGAGLGATRLRLPVAGEATARNMNTVARLVDLMG